MSTILLADGSLNLVYIMCCVDMVISSCWPVWRNGTQGFGWGPDKPGTPLALHGQFTEQRWRGGLKSVRVFKGYCILIYCSKVTHFTSSKHAKIPILLRDLL